MVVQQCRQAGRTLPLSNRCTKVATKRTSPAVCELLFLPKEARRAAAMRLRHNGFKETEIARILGVSRGNISHLLNGR